MKNLWDFILKKEINSLETEEWIRPIDWLYIYSSWMDFKPKYLNSRNTQAYHRNLEFSTSFVCINISFVYIVQKLWPADFSKSAYHFRSIA